MKGRVVSDLFLYAKVNFKMTSYKLDVMAKAYIKDTTGKVVLSVPGWIDDSMAAVREALLNVVPPDHEAVIALDQRPLQTTENDELVILDESDEEAENKKEDVEHPYNALLRKSAAALTAAQSTPVLKEAFKQALTATG
jgi:polynucleotide 5'-kinase involved in rRNA processing